jgi:outer membrane protein OmpA-like peptidoglycan-associated protein
VGNAKLNQLLSENRARVIHNYLVGKGIDSKRLKFAGYGQTKPVSPNDTEENKSKNRRVECLVLAN